MYLIIVYVSLVLSFVPAQGASVANFFRRIPYEMDDNIKQDNVPVSAIFEVNKHAGQGPDDPDIEFGDIAVATGLQNADPCTARGCKWEGSQDGKVYVPYAISSQYSPQEKAVIEEGLNSFHKSTCIRFVPHKGERHFLDIKSVSGCYSYLGRQAEGQVVSLDRLGCVYHKAVQHEVLHALGFHHEQNRSDRDKHVQILLQNVQSGKERNFKKRDTNNLHTPYDYGSIMHYSRYAFSQNTQPTIVPIPNKDVVIGEAKQMSHNDIARVNNLYCEKKF